VSTGHILCCCSCCSGRTDRSSQTKTRLATITGTVPQRGFRLPVRYCMLCIGEEVAGCAFDSTQVVLRNYHPAWSVVH
jgi:hypothetical protein